MDYARKIGKSKEPTKWVNQPPSILTISDPPLCSDRVFKEDRRLKNWRRWLSNRKNQFNRVKSETGRHQTDHVMNSCETVRPLVETRTMMDYAAMPLPVIPDKYRGGPEFWTIPPTIPKSDPCLPDITFAPSKKDLNELPQLTHVGLPELIEEEKDLAGLRLKTPLWKRSEYLKKRKEELSEEIELLVPSKPDSRHLIIKNRAVPKKIELPRIPPITISQPEDEESCEYPLQVVVLKIQDTEICQMFMKSEEKSEPIRWILNFSSKVNHTDEKEIVFENKGNRVIIYQWRDARFRSKVMPLSRKISPFFFNKTKGVILPGQFVNLKIWFRSRTSGIFIESWKLITDPQLCSSPLIFRFWGHTDTSKRDENKFTPVDEYLDHCIRNSAIRQIIDEIIEDIYSIQPPGPAYGSLFLDSEVFLAKNAMCFYSPSLLMEFQQIYQSATNRNEERWNLSINDLRDVILAMKQPERRHLLLTQLNQLYKKCLMPTLYRPVRSNKHEMVYNLLASLFNRFEIESHLSKEACLRDEREINSTSSTESTKLMNIGETVVYAGKSRSSSRSDYAEEMRKSSSSVFNNLAYRETFFIRIYQLLAETLERISASIDTFNNLNESYK